MPETSDLKFGPFRLAGPNGPLFLENRRLKLKPKTVGVLWLLARQAGEVVTKNALLDALWPKTAVGEDALAFQIQALRRVLEDDARKPRYIATHHRVGYSFIARVMTAAPPVDRTFVGREAQLTRLRQHYAKALRGERQLVLVTGEAGVGKTTLVESFLAEASENPLIGRGQCVGQHGAGEAYLPVLEALGRICREARGGQVIDSLLKIAPTWMMQLPALLSADDGAALRMRAAGASRERMLREIADALEVLSAETPLILVLEDLHWSDPSTVDMLALLARRSERARLLVVGTYRPPELSVARHPLKPMKQELAARGQAVEIALQNLEPADVRSYLARRFPETGDERDFSGLVYRRTEGHPLFMVQMAEYLAQLGPEGARDAVVPNGLQELIEVQLGQLTEAELQVLEVASVAGAEFAAASVAAGAEDTVEGIEARCEGLVRHGQFIEDRGLATWPDGTVSERYGFRHALYRDVLYGRLNARQRARLHLAIGTREEAGQGARSMDLAAELAAHFELGRDYRRAVDYHRLAGSKALQRSANAEAVAHFNKGLELLESLPDTPARAQHEFRLQVGSSLAFTMTKGYSAPEVEKTSVRARELSRHMKETPEVSFALFRVYQFYSGRAELNAARELSQQLLRIAERAKVPMLLSRAHTAVAHEVVSRGNFAAAREHAERSLAAYDPEHHRSLGAMYGDDPGVVALVVRAWALQVLGYSDQAAASMQKYMAAAKALSLPYALSAVLTSAADLHTLRRASAAAQASAEAAIAISTREGFPYVLARSTIVRGWALAEQGKMEAGIAELREGLDAFQATGARLWMPRYLGLLAEAYGKAGQIDDGLEMLTEALELVRRTDEREYEAELHRLKGELTLPDPAEAEKCFRKAIAVARRQEARLFELRATMSLARLRQRQRKTKAARKMLAEVSGWFAEGFDTKDLEEAKAMLAELAA